MNFKRKIIVILTAFAVVFAVSFAAVAQEAKGALLRGYRTGYSDGYMSGYRDSVERAKRDAARHQDYAKANRAYRADYGSLEDYRDGYQQGYEGGYDAGYDRKEFDSVLPTDLARRGAKSPAPKPDKKIAATAPKPKLQTGQTKPVNPQPEPQPEMPRGNNSALEPTIIIPTNTEIVVEMLADVNTSDSREGDSFLARIVAPQEINGAVIEGKITKIKRPGRVKGNAELQLSFNRIVVNDRRWANFNATVIEALPLKGNNIKRIDEEGTVEGKSSVKGDLVKVGAATGTGAVVGAVAGGPVGAAVGAAIGGAFGIGGVLVSRGNEIKLIQGQQLRVRTNFESQIR